MSPSSADPHGDDNLQLLTHRLSDRSLYNSNSAYD